MWPGTAASIPAGWVRETALDARYVRGAPTGADGDLATDRGNVSHAHTSPSHQPIQNSHLHGVSGATFTPPSFIAGAGPISSTHSHVVGGSDPATAITNGLAITVNATVNDPPFVEVLFIQSDGTPTGVPAGACALRVADDVPLGWARAFQDRFPKGAAGGGDGGAVGGSATHGHVSPAHTHTAVAHAGTGTTAAATLGTSNIDDSPDVVFSAVGHTHAYSLTAATQTIDSVTTEIEEANGEPPFTKLNVFRNENPGPSLPDKTVAMWGGPAATVPTGWSRVAAMDDRFLKAAGANGESGITVGGSSQHAHTAADCAPTAPTHTHSNLTGVTSSPTVLRTEVSEGGAARRSSIATHVHSWTIGAQLVTHTPVAVTVDDCAAEAAFPKYRRVLFVEFTAPPAAWTLETDRSIERVEYKTDILAGYDTREQRIRLGGGSIRRMELEIVAVEAREAQLAAGMVFSSQEEGIGVPLWQYGSRLASGISAGDVVVPIGDAELVPYVADGLAILWVNAFDWEVVNVASVSGAGVHLSLGVTQAWAVGAWIYPARLARIVERLGVRWLSSAVLEGRLEFELV